MWQPTATFETIKLRAGILKKIRAFFESRDVIEVDTPIMSAAIGTDPYLDFFSSMNHFHSSGESQKVYFQTSPEYSMKRLLCKGYGCIYQITKAFRNEPSGSHHNPEFSMLEWYRLGYDHNDLISEVGDFLSEVLGTSSYTKISYKEVFLNFVKVDPLVTSHEELINIIDHFEKLSDWHKAETNLDMLLQFIFSEIIEPSIGKDQPWFVYDFPASQASLARLSEHDSRVAHRFECYYQGLELANGFYELKDSSEQLSRFERDNEDRKSLNKEEVIIDTKFIEALESGLPDCSGVALGVDRLVMLALGKKTIKDVITFPIENA